MWPNILGNTYPRDLEWILEKFSRKLYGYSAAERYPSGYKGTVC